MGIKNLWQLLSPVGRSVSIETLAGKVRHTAPKNQTTQDDTRIPLFAGAVAPPPGVADTNTTPSHHGTDTG